MRRKLIILTVTVILIFGCLCALAACGKSGGNTPSTGGSGCVSIPHYWDCEYVSNKNIYDINDVTLTFIYGYTHESSEMHYFSYPGDYEKRDENGKYPPVKIDLYFSSFGNEHYIKTVDDFFSEEYLAKNHSEKITVPAELFYNEYGLIKFYLFDAETERDNYKMKAGRDWDCYFYYKKVGDTVYIGDKDFAPAENDGSSDIEYLTDYDNKSSFRPTDASQTEFCDFATKFTRDLDDGDLNIEFSFGSMRTENRAKSVEVYAVKKEMSGQKKLLTTVNDYDSENYNCSFNYDYFGKVRKIVYGHSEKFDLPKEWFSGETGEIELYVYDTENKMKLSSIIIKYEFSNVNNVWLHYNIKQGTK